MYKEEVLLVLGLKYVKELALFDKVTIRQLPEYLEPAIERIRCVCKMPTTQLNEKFVRAVLDQIIFAAAYEESASELGYPNRPQSALERGSEDPAVLCLRHETHLVWDVKHKGVDKQLNGLADYAIYYDSPEADSLATNLLVVEAKRTGGADQVLSQLAGYMGVIHAARNAKEKPNSIVFGIATDGNQFKFCRIDNDDNWIESRQLIWEGSEDDKVAIYSIIVSLLKTAAMSSPSVSPIKSLERQQFVLDAFASPKTRKHLDFGMAARLEIFVEE